LAGAADEDNHLTARSSKQRGYWLTAGAALR
jgi:hypothetical protein